MKRFVLGFVRLRVTGSELDRFLNLCAMHGLRFWGHARPVFDTMEISLTARDFLSLPQIARKSRCRVRILEKRGLPFFRKKIRPVLAVGLLVFALCGWVMSGFLWTVEITGADAETRDLARRALLENGVTMGVPIRKLNLAAIRNRILLEHPELIYINLNLHGGHADVVVRKRTFPPHIVERDGFANVVAREGGIIERITVYEGTPEVSPGDLVRPGQLLANGYMTGRSGVTVSTHARADVYARTWTQSAARFPLDAKQITKNEKNFSKYTLIFGKKRIKIFQNGSIEAGECDRIIKRTQLTLPGGIPLPLVLERETAQGCTLDEGRLSLPYAVAAVTRALEDSLSLSDSDRLCDLRFSAREEVGAVRVEMIAECVKQIGVEQ